VTDSAHVQTKSRNSLFESRDISVIQIENPTAAPILNYRTAIDPALIAAKSLPVDLRGLDLNGESIPFWYSKYGTGLNPAEIFHKSNILAGGKQQILLGDAPYVSDIGASVGLPQPAQPSLDDLWHKNVVTDLSPCDVIIAATLQFPSNLADAYSYVAQKILAPISSRHIVKTPEGYLHAVTTYIISGLSRIVYFKSINGGETWTATIVDNNDGNYYIHPSITCDRYGGIHITFTRWDQVNFPTYWLYCGGATPAGFELVSNNGNLAYHRPLGGGEGYSYPAIGVDPDPYNLHYNASYSTVGGINGVINKMNEGLGGDSGIGGWHHTAISATLSSETLLPPSRSLKLLRYWGIPPSLPADIIVLFNSNVPAGYTRYSDQDNYGIYLSDDVGTLVGAAQHRHLYSYTVDGVQNCLKGGTAGGTVVKCYHSHVGSFYTSYAANNPPSYGVVLGRVSAPLSVIAANALLIAGSTALLSALTCLSANGQALYNKFFVGKASYSDLGGSLTHDHDDIATTTVGPTGGCNNRLSMTDTSYATCAHTHNLSVAFDPFSNIGAYMRPYIYSVDSQLDLTRFGQDLFYRYISPAGVMAPVINISQIYSEYPSFEGICLADGSDNLHFLWSGAGINPFPYLGNARICYKKMTGGVLGARVDVTTSNDHMLYPSMDIDKNGDVHTAWYNYTTNQAVQYRKCASGVWGAIENVDTDSYVGITANIITDKDLNVYLFYCKWTDPGTAIKEVFYRKRTSAGWSAAVNLSPNKASAGYNQFVGQIYLDNKGNVVFTWTGKGYGAHTSVYHPVYRYIKPDGTIVPAVGVDAVDLFPSDDTEIIYPTVFWHSFPLTDQVYQNLVTSGLTFMYLYNPRGATNDIADLKFYSSADALIGDVGQVGSGGLGDGNFNPSGVSAESILQSETFNATVRGYIGRSHLTRGVVGDYFV
jgi:hypothetical protein